MSDSEDGTEEEHDNKPGTLIEFPTLSNLNIQRATQWKFQTKEETTN
jgi:hypothetical protein